MCRDLRRAVLHSSGAAADGGSIIENSNNHTAASRREKAKLIFALVISYGLERSSSSGRSLKRSRPSSRNVFHFFLARPLLPSSFWPVVVAESLRGRSPAKILLPLIRLFPSLSSVVVQSHSSRARFQNNLDTEQIYRFLDRRSEQVTRCRDRPA